MSQLVWQMHKAMDERLERDRVMANALATANSCSVAYRVACEVEAEPCGDDPETAAARKEVVNICLRTLPLQRAMVIALRFGMLGEDAMTLEQVGQRLCVTRERVRQIEMAALNHLRMRFGRHLKEWL